jgi:hypothetical protein
MPCSNIRRTFALTFLFCIIVLPAALATVVAACTRAIQGAIRYADKPLQICDGEGSRSASTASDHS